MTEVEAPEPTLVTPNLVPKRQAIAQNMVGQAAVIAAALTELNYLAQQYLQCGTFLDTDFVGVNAIQQLNAFQVGLFLTTVVPALQSWYTTALPNSGPIPQQIFMQLLS